MKKSIAIIYLILAVFMSSCDTFDDPIGTEINDVTLKVVNSEGVPLSSVWINFYYTDKQPNFVVDSTFTSVLGNAEIKSLEPRNYLMKAFDLAGEELGSKEITIEKDNSLNKIEWVLDVYVENYDFTVSLIDNRKNPIVGRKVALFTTETNPSLIKEGKSGPDGKVVFSNTVVGEYTVLVYDEENTGIFAQTISNIGAQSENWKEFVIRRIFHNTKVVITGFMSDPRGSDSPKTGAVSGDGFVHPGQYEYVQLMAVKDVDFSVEPYSVVFTSSSIITSWAHGVYNPTDKRNYQINLTTGSVKKGDYFYVGSHARMIASYYQLIPSPVVDKSRFWGVDYAAETGGNGNGAAKDGSGLIGNGSGKSGLLATSKAYPDGIAVFNKTDVDKNTIPVDAIFFGTTINYDETVQLQIPNNDLYSRTNLETDEPQPIFGSGTNTYLFPVPGQDMGVYMKLGGQVTSEEWLIPRSGTPILFNMKDTPGASVADIENAADCTMFISK